MLEASFFHTSFRTSGVHQKIFIFSFPFSRLTEFLTDCAERICLLKLIHRRVNNRFQRFLLWLGYPRGIIPETKITHFCKTLSEFALEYRTTRERIIAQKQKKQKMGERKKTRGQLISEIISGKSASANGRFTNGLHTDDESESTPPTANGSDLRQALVRDISATKLSRTPAARPPPIKSPISSTNTFHNLEFVIKSTSREDPMMLGGRLRQKAARTFVICTLAIRFICHPSSQSEQSQCNSNTRQRNGTRGTRYQ